ncbi:hypothetical protein NDU88_005183 [Pleurodeles waltl]|uniref:Uncharacterized protein n=1 Tax=Pleurodeles waltl TaxID=8319 RepID=A0AAV7L0G8_PLEWA|nr:hypothetical protein NDU88_005183 [Pleurodeles waltl]
MRLCRGRGTTLGKRLTQRPTDETREIGCHAQAATQDPSRPSGPGAWSKTPLSSSEVQGMNWKSCSANRGGQGSLSTSTTNSQNKKVFPAV